MRIDFKILDQFLRRSGDEVGGRQEEAAPEDIHNQLRQLVLGSLETSEEDKLFSWLTRNPEWIANLAEEIKAQRTRLRARPN